MGRLLRGGVFGARVAKAHRVDAGEKVFTPAEKHGGHREVELRSVGIPLGLELSTTIVVNCALRLLSASALTVCATYSLGCLMLLSLSAGCALPDSPPAGTDEGSVSVSQETPWWLKKGERTVWLLCQSSDETMRQQQSPWHWPLQLWSNVEFVIE